MLHGIIISHKTHGEKQYLVVFQMNLLFTVGGGFPGIFLKQTTVNNASIFY